MRPLATKIKIITLPLLCEKYTRRVAAPLWDELCDLVEPSLLTVQKCTGRTSLHSCALSCLEGNQLLQEHLHLVGKRRSIYITYNKQLLGKNHAECCVRAAEQSRAGFD